MPASRAPTVRPPARSSATSWLPDLPPRLKRRIIPFTVHRDGFIRRKTDEPRSDHPLSVMGRAEFLRLIAELGAPGAVDALEQRWEQRREEYEAKAKGEYAVLRVAGGLEAAHLVSEFYEHLDQRVEFGRPKKMSPVTRWDYQRTINAWLAAVGPATAVNQLGPEDNGAFARSIVNSAASRFEVMVSYLHYFMGWALKLGRFADNRVIMALVPGMDPISSLLGPELVKPSRDDVRDERLQKAKSLTPAEIGRIWHVADDEEKLIVALGLNGAFDNGDIANLTWRVIVPAAREFPGLTGATGLVIDYRRRKRGRIRRVVPLLPEVGCRLADQLLRRGNGDDDDGLVFVAPDGSPLNKLSASGPQNLITRRFARLMIRAGLRTAPVLTRDPETRKRHAKSAGTGDGRGFRSLRTSFANLAPTGFRDELEIVMGHAQGQVILDSYMETHGFNRLYELVSAVWTKALSEPPDAAWRDAHPAPEPRGR